MKRVAILCVLGVLLLTFQAQAADIFKISYEGNFITPQAKSSLGLEKGDWLPGYDIQLGFAFIFWSFGKTVVDGGEIKHSGVLVNYSIDKDFYIGCFNPYIELGVGSLRVNDVKRRGYVELNLGLKSGHIHLSLGLRNSWPIFKVGLGI